MLPPARNEWKVGGDVPRPGVMIYFDMMPAMKFLSYEQKGRLLEAILKYAESGEEPYFDDPMLGMAWYFIAPRIDKDGEVYDEKVEQKKYAVYCREAKKKETTPLSFEEWRQLPEEQR